MWQVWFSSGSCGSLSVPKVWCGHWCGSNVVHVVHHQFLRSGVDIGVAGVVIGMVAV